MQGRIWTPHLSDHEAVRPQPQGMAHKGAEASSFWGGR